MNVFLSELAASKLQKLAQYLLEHWSLKTKDQFIEKLTAKINQVSTQPHSCPQSTEFRGLYKCVVTKQTTFYYRIVTESNEIEIITFFDSRQDANKLNEDIK
ncbi:type II toxin-antitoxin system RelE/ParE family toxin [Kordia jejudonensis]|uniref:type II toxin-antitoxin system RelE/ParE family toxin n=1 Tax=Kordia jejudonensis TaxID=1348245 RepID=UPI0006292749|nr:type II toxin-antitoxin system RelE/ParE family toxin [Kordia jejudonensis]